MSASMRRQRALALLVVGCVGGLSRIRVDGGQQLDRVATACSMASRGSSVAAGQLLPNSMRAVPSPAGCRRRGSGDRELQRHSPSWHARRRRLRRARRHRPMSVRLRSIDVCRAIPPRGQALPRHKRTQQALFLPPFAQTISTPPTFSIGSSGYSCRSLSARPLRFGDRRRDCNDSVDAHSKVALLTNRAQEAEFLRWPPRMHARNAKLVRFGDRGCREAIFSDGVGCGTARARGRSGVLKTPVGSPVRRSFTTIRRRDSASYD